MATLEEGLVLNIAAHFRKKIFSPYDITPRDGGEDVGNNNPPFILAGKWPSSAAKRSSRAAKCPSWGSKWLSSCALLKTARWLTIGGCAVQLMGYVNGCHIGVFYNRSMYNDSISKRHHVLRKTQVLEFRHNSTTGGDNHALCNMY